MYTILGNPTIKEVVTALQEVQKGCTKNLLTEKSAREALRIMKQYPEITRLHVKGGARVAHAYTSKYAHVASGLICERIETGLQVTVSRATGNDSNSWAQVWLTKDADRQKLCEELNLDRWNRISYPGAVE